MINLIELDLIEINLVFVKIHENKFSYNKLNIKKEDILYFLISSKNITKKNGDIFSQKITFEFKHNDRFEVFKDNFLSHIHVTLEDKFVILDLIPFQNNFTTREENGFIKIEFGNFSQN